MIQYFTNYYTQMFGAIGLVLGAIVGAICLLIFLRFLKQAPRTYFELRMYREEERMDEYWSELTIQLVFGIGSFIGTLIFFPCAIAFINHWSRILMAI